MTAGPDLPEALAKHLEGLFDHSWRERKAAVEGLSRAVVSVRDHAAVDLLSERLLDGLVSPDTLTGRSACHEVLVAIGEACVAKVLARLEHPGPGRRLLVDLLGEVGNQAQVGLLTDIAVDGNEDENVRAAAAGALGAIGGARARAALETLLEVESEMLRVYALDALRASDAAVDVSRLEPLVAVPATRRGAAALLGVTRSGDALAMLVPLLLDSMAGVRAVAAMALVRLDEGLATVGQPELVRAALAQIGEDKRARVRELIHHREPEVRAAALRLATLAGDPEALPPLLPVMDDPVIQERAMTSVAELGPAANPALVRMAEAVEETQREHLFRLIGALKVEVVDPRLLTMLTEGLEDANEETACAAAEALKFVGARSSLGSLYRAMGIDGQLGEAAADALGEIAARSGRGRYDDLTLIVGESWPQHGALARNLCRVVGRLRAPAYVPPLVSLLGSTDMGVRVAAAQALGQIAGEHEGVGALSFALTDEEPQVRAAVCRSLGQLGAPQSCNALLSATTDTSPLVRAAAVQALVSLDNPIALGRLREIVAEDAVPTVVVHAIAGLGSSALEQDLTMLMSLCTSADHEVVKAAARALEKFSAHRATAALVGLLDHERWDARWAAAEALAKRGDVTALAPMEAYLVDETDELVRQVLEDGVARLRALMQAGSPA